MANKMKREKETPLEKQKKYFQDKLLTMPGINEAIDLVQGHAWVRAVDEAIDAASKGEFGDEARQIISVTTGDPLGKLLNFGNVESCVYEFFDEWLEILAVKSGPKIAELWGLSEAAGRRLAAVTYWGEYNFTLREADFSPLVLLVNAEGEKDTEILKRHQREFQKKNCVIFSTDRMLRGHIYLDVTELTYSRFRSAYKAINLCREYLDIKKKDLQAGAPSKIDTEKALDAIYLKNRHESSKKIARQLGFKIYGSDNPSGSYPLLHKYFKIGKDLEERLIKLDKFLPTIKAEVDHELSK